MTNRSESRPSHRSTAGLFGLVLAGLLCSASVASAAEAPESPAPAAPVAQPKTAAAAAAVNAAEVTAKPAEAAAPQAPNTVIRDQEPITAPPGPPQGQPPPPGTRPYARRSRRLLESSGPRESSRGDARQGLLLSIGVGGASQFTSTPGLGRTASSDVDLRIGYGFSDRLQMFLDFNGQNSRYGYGQSTSMDTVTLRAQTVLLGDRRGNGLTINAGIGLGSFNDNTGDWVGANDYCCAPSSHGRYYNDKPLGFVVAGGLSYDARLGRYLSLSPEIFGTWMAIPNDDRKQDIATQVGVRLRLLWYLK